MTATMTMGDELIRLRARLPELRASVLATADGLLVSHDAGDLEPDGIAALAAAQQALANRFAHTVGHGELRESVVQCDRGYISSYAAGPAALLTLVTAGAANLAMVHLEARRCVRRLQPLLDARTHHPRPEAPAQPNRAGTAPPLARRVPMATLPDSMRRAAG